ncbi:MAG: hypothetical protein NXI01_07110 [Gammaproteobacteria bacterium]|nr:hypothetical protein [Gammaproteobacteria bacterium]
MPNYFLEYLSKLHCESEPLNQALAEFTPSKEHTLHNFKEGIKRFVHLANMLPEKREEFYGSRFSGLYLHNDLAQLWNERCPTDQRVEATSLNTLKPKDWDTIDTDQNIVLHYFGPHPAEALNHLIKGPAVIDCGMFCQLGIWFGIRFILGDDTFNTHFGNKPFMVTRHLYQPMVEGKEHFGNPLFDFFTADNLTDSVAVEHLFNVAHYTLKHPGGTSRGQNCLIVDDIYYVFDTHSSIKKFTRLAITTQLLEAYNAAPDVNDQDTIAVFKDNPAFFQSQYGSIYAFPECTISWAKTLWENPQFLKEYTNAMLAIPECRAQMNTIFGQENSDLKINFIKSFADPRAHREKYEAFYASPNVKQAFQAQLETNKTLFDQYYQDILEIFADYHQAIADETFSLEDYQKNCQSTVPTIPSCLHFNLNTFLNTLTCTSTTARPRKKTRRDESAKVSNTNAAFFTTPDPQTLNSEGSSLTLGYKKGTEENSD